MGLVDYSDSDDEGTGQASSRDASPPSKRRRTTEDSDKKKTLPPLPSTFRDLYSSTVRTSTRDDPALHGGRKRITPHVAGNWPTHVYLEWNPPVADADVLREIVKSAKDVAKTIGGQHGGEVHSLLQNDLGVSLPLHVSLSRPLALPTSDKDVFVDRLTSRLRTGHVHTFTVQPLETIWHPNEDQTRWFYVLRLRRPSGDELRNLLELCNNVADEFKQPLLYREPSEKTNIPQPASSQPDEGAHDSFHVSLAWSLKPQDTAGSTGEEASEGGLRTMQSLQIEFTQVKIRVGQEVTSCPLLLRRANKES